MSITNRTLLIDGDILVFQACASLEHPTKYDEDTWILWASETETKDRCDDSVKTLRDKALASDVILTFSDPLNFRKTLEPTYKANRAKTRKPMLLPLMRDYLKTKYRSMQYRFLEADDVIGILATNDGLFDDVVIWSPDKDLRQIPGQHLVDDEVIKITPEQGFRTFLMQTLTGDQTDNYPGCPGIGPKRAAAMLDDDCSWDTVVAAFQKAGLTGGDALLQAQLARILQHGEYETNSGVVHFWRPDGN